ncbi:hypothetical protein ACVIW3_002077 [Bradyrhizobium diazoefficiens]
MPAPDSAMVAHHDRGFGDAEPRAAIGLRHADAEPAGVGQRLVEIVREAAVVVLLQPVGIGKTFTDLGDGIANGFLLIGEREIHVLDLLIGSSRGSDPSAPSARAARE